MKLGVRGSKLALAYADKVVHKLESPTPIEIVPIKTTADIHENKAIQDIGGKGVFVTEIEQKLLDKTIDIAVHSFKDLPAEMDKDLEIIAVLERNDPRDCYVGKLHPHARVGTGSPRRIAQLKENFNVEFDVKPIRGNIDTRLKKLDNDEYDAVIFAVAGLEALQLEKRIQKILPFDKMLPCVGQGVIAIQARKDMLDKEFYIKKLNHLPTYFSVMSERAMLQEIEGDCHTAVGAISTLVGDCLILEAINYNNNKHWKAMSKRNEYSWLGKEVGKKIK